VRVDQVTPVLLERLATLSDEWRFLENREDGAPTPEQEHTQDETDWPTRIELVTSEAQLQQLILTAENKMPDLAGWFVPHLLLAGVSLVLVLVAALAFKRSRETLS